MHSHGKALAAAALLSLNLTACGGHTGSTSPAMLPAQPQQVAAASRAAFSPNFKPSSCTGSITVHFNGKTIPPGSYLWFDSVFALHDANSGAFEMQNSKVLLNGITYSGPVGFVTVSSAYTTSTVTDSGPNYLVSDFPEGLSGKKFMDGMIVYLPNGLSAHQIVTWTARFQSTNTASNGMKIQWQWTASAFSTLGTLAQLGIKPIDGPNGSSYANSDKAGTPENYIQDFIPGAREASANDTGAWSGTQMITLCPCNATP
jgi:hypothetical protein